MDWSEAKRILIGLVAVFLGVALLGTTLVGSGAATPTPVSNCTTIGAPGSYELTADITNSAATTCIEITVSDVIFDGNGHTIDGDGGGGTAIMVSDGAVSGNATTLSNVTVRNVTATDWGTGIQSLHVQNSAIDGVEIDDSTGAGMVFVDTQSTTVTASVVANSARDGIRILSESSDVVVSGSRSLDNGAAGVTVAGESTSNEVIDSEIARNWVGVSISARSNGTRIADATVANHTGDGIEIEDAAGTTVENVTIRSSGSWDLQQIGIGSVRTTRLNLSSATIDSRSKNVALRGNDSVTVSPTGYTDAGGSPKVTAVNTSSGAFLDVNVSYDDYPGLDEPSLRLWRNDGTWSQVAGTNGVDTVAEYVYANVTTFAGTPENFAPMGGMLATVPVNDCMVIDSPGNYALQQDLTDRPEQICIDIQSSTVTFDGNGHVIDSDGATSLSVGVSAYVSNGSGAGLSGVTVRNLSVTDWTRGVRFRRVDDGEITGVTATNNALGLVARDGAPITVADVVAVDNGAGTNPVSATGYHVRLQNVTESSVTNVSVSASGMGIAGVEVWNAHNVSVTDVTVDDAGSFGVRVVGGSDNTVRSADVDGAAWGLSAETSDRTAIRDSIATGSSIYGVHLATSMDLRVRNVTESGSAQQSLVAEQTANNVTVREFHLGNTSAPTTVDAAGSGFRLEPVASPPADPSGEHNVSRFVRVSGGTSSPVVVNVSYTDSDVTAANVNESTIDPWVHDGSWSQATGPAGVDTNANYVYADVSGPGSAGVVVAPMGAASTSGSGPGFGLLTALVGVLLSAAALRRWDGPSVG